LKTQYILTEEEYNRIIGIFEEMDADLGTLINHMESEAHVKKYAICLSILMGKLGKSLEFGNHWSPVTLAT